MSVKDEVAKVIAGSVLREMRKWDGVGGPEIASQMGAYIEKVAKRIAPRIIRLVTITKVKGGKK